MRGSQGLAGLVLIMLVAVAAAGCGGVAPGAERGPGAARVDIPIPEEPGPQRSAALLRVRCGSQPVSERMSCYEAATVEVLAEDGVAATMAMLDRLAELDPDARHQGHVLAHVVGLAAYRSTDAVGETFAQCSPSFQSGCYHGVIQAYFADVQARGGTSELTARELNRLCSDHRGADGSMWLLFQCVHGIGHGLVALHDFHLPRALEGCDLLADEWEREGCYGGAFMENLVNATMPHHAPDVAHHAGGHGAPGAGHQAHGGAGHGEHRTAEPQAAAAEGAEHHHHEHHGEEHHPAAEQHAEHEHRADGDEASGEPFKALDPEDPHYPCSALGERYLQACYSMQTSAVLFWSEGDVQAGIRFCDEAPDSVRTTCYISLGRDINAYTRQNHRRSIEKCMLVPEPHRAACGVGVVKNVIDVTASAADGVPFCSGLPAGDVRVRCFQAIGEQVAVLEPDPAQRASFCQTLADPDRQACRAGIGLHGEPVPAAASR